MNCDTIFALSSAPGVAGIAVIRVSGPEAGRALTALSGRGLPAGRRAVVRELRAVGDGRLLDRALCIWFPGDHSFSGEPVVELQVHGGLGVVDGVLAALAELPGFRLAAPGEFTRRAFEHGKLDLLQVEAIGDLVAARTSAQVQQALAQDEGTLGRRILEWRGRLLGIAAQVESAIDFVDEDLADVAVTALGRQVAVLAGEIEGELSLASRGVALRSGYLVAILGQPNVGKSSLLNRLAGLDAAIVSEVAGTTRDVIQVEMSLDGVLVRLCDTAGLRTTSDTVEEEGVARALSVAERSDLVVMVVDNQRCDAAAFGLAGSAPRLVVQNKSDLLRVVPPNTDERVFVSARDGAGIDGLLERMVGVLGVGNGVANSGLVSRERQQVGLRDVAAALRSIDWSVGLELIGEDLVRAVGSLEGVVGVGVAEDVLDALFAEFCIGK